MQNLSESHFQLLRLLSVTMASPALLVQGGVFYTPESVYKTNLRQAQRTLKKLAESRFVSSQTYLTATNSSRFYYPTDKTFQTLNKSAHKFHIIHENTVEHDSLTALFLIHTFRWGYPENVSIRWIPPFAIGDKECDGGIEQVKDGRVILTIILESDNGTHDHQEIREKILAYRKYLEAHPTHQFAFLVSSDQRRENLRTTVLGIKELGNFYQNVSFICPHNLPPDG
jgi:hypothetical protein